MTTAIIIIVLVFALIVGGMMGLLKNKNFKIPKDYDPSKSGYDDEDDDDRSGF
jgi:hypothetical protein